MASKQRSWFFCRGYFESSDQVLRAVLSLGVRHYAFICHDKDVWLDTTERHEKGDKKDPHWHIIINLEQKATAVNVQKKFKAVVPDCGIYVQYVYDTMSAADYLVHDSDTSRAQGKHQYDRSEVFSDDLAYICSERAQKENNEEKVDLIDQFCSEVIEMGYVTRYLLVEYKRFGKRDFIFNYKRALTFCADVLGISSEQLFLTPEQRLEEAASVTEVKENDC